MQANNISNDIISYFVQFESYFVETQICLMPAKRSLL